MTVITITPRPSASGNSSSGHPQHLGVIVLTVTQEGMKYLYTVPATLLRVVFADFLGRTAGEGSV